MRFAAFIIILLVACGARTGLHGTAADATRPLCVTAGAAQLTAEGASTSIFVDGGYLYWGVLAEPQPIARIRRMTTSGGPIEELATVPNDVVANIDVALSAQFVVVATQSSGPNLFRVPRGGGAATSLGHFDLASVSMAADDAHVYVGTSDGALVSVPLDGAPTTTLVQGLASVSGALPNAVDSSHLYATAAHSLAAVDLSSASITDLGPVAGPVTMDADHLYALTPHGLSRMAKLGGDQALLVPVASATAIVADEAFAYWSDLGGVQKVAKTGGATARITASGPVLALAVDGSCVYWAGEPGLWTAPK